MIDSATNRRFFADVAAQDRATANCLGVTNPIPGVTVFYQFAWGVIKTEHANTLTGALVSASGSRLTVKGSERR